MEDLLIEILETFGYPVRRQGSYKTGEAYPEHFFTFWNDDSNDHAHYDNSRFGVEYTYEVNFYSTDPEMAYDILRQAIAKLKSSGFIVSGDGYDLMCDEPTHVGRAVDVAYLKI